MKAVGEKQLMSHGATSVLKAEPWRGFVSQGDLEEQQVSWRKKKVLSVIGCLKNKVLLSLIPSIRGICWKRSGLFRVGSQKDPSERMAFEHLRFVKTL